MKPTSRALAIVAVWAALGLIPAFAPALTFVWAIVGALGMLAIALDAFLVAATEAPSAQRTHPPVLALATWEDVTLELRWPKGVGSTVATVMDGHPVDVDVEGLPAEVEAIRDKRSVIPYRLRPRRRGAMHFGAPYVRIRGRLGLVSRMLRPECETATRVFPNFRPTVEFAMLSLAHRAGDMGVHIKRRRGIGTEFLQLREYRPGDSFRQIDWAAVARRDRLISRDYHDEEGQQLIIALDCGRRMRAKEGIETHFDHVLNAMLLLAFVALRRGDAVGVQAFGGDERWLPATKGSSAFHRLMDGVYSIEATLEPPDYSALCERLLHNQKRRALIVILTNVRDDDATEMRAALAPLRRRHMVLVASLREVAIREALAAPIQSLDDALSVAGAAQYDASRRRAHDTLQQRGVRALDVEPSELPVALVNEYLEIKRGQLL